MLLVAEGDAEIDRQPGPLLAVAEAVDRQIHADLADPAERCKYQFFRLRHHAAPTEATAPKTPPPAAPGTRGRSAVRTIRHPVSSIVPKMPPSVIPPVSLPARSPR